MKVILAPLAERMRPQNLENYIGQKHLVGVAAVLRKSIQTGNLPSLILWGPPGVGKTTLAAIISKSMDRPFFNLSAINAGVKEVREVIEKASKLKNSLLEQGPPILFIDEIHRFSKSQQDSLLSAVEQGLVTLIGATTENPSFEVISALRSRCQIYILNELSQEELLEMMYFAIENDVVLKEKKIEIIETEALLRLSGGDARKLLNVLEIVVQALDGVEIKITNANVMQYIQQNIALYDKSGAQHYDIISAFIKSIRGSDPNAAVYWLARMIAGGEEPKFIARRMLILASEDIGNANPNALLLANNCFQAVSAIGYPESRIILSQTAIYLANAAKSNASYEAINKAQTLIEATGDLPVPLHLRNAASPLMKEMGYGRDYQYAHAFEGNFVEQEFMPEALSGHKLFEPQNNAREIEARQRLKNLWGKKYDY